ncbi:MAG: transposase [Marinomonas sp.]|uniref:transposase n=1 Tax=Marinomonas sp. TaxID=1904862 RepID=UPI003F98D625
MNPLELEQAQYIKSIINELDAAGRGERSAVLQRACDHLCWSKDKLYRRMKALGRDSNRKARADKGKSLITREEAEAIAGLIRSSERDNGKRLMTIKTAIDLAQANGLLNSYVSASTVLRAFERYKLHPDHMNSAETTRTMRSLHPNHVHQFDVSICVLYYLKNDKGLRAMPESEFYKNKPDNLEKIKNNRVLRYLITDHYTGAFFVRYYMAPGENTETITQFLFEAFCERETGELLFGVPKIMIWDAGSANIAHQTRHLLDTLQVKHIAHTPGKPWAKGQVETTHNLVERQFESRLSFMTVNSVEELNAAVIKWSIGFQSRIKHSRHKSTRFGLWQTIRQEQLRLIPDVALVKSLIQQTKPETRIVKANNLSISFAPKGYGAQEYSLEHIPHIVAGDEVKVFVNPYSAPDIRVLSVDVDGVEHTHEAKAIEKDSVGFPLSSPVIGERFAAMRETQSDHNRKALDTAAWGTDNGREIKKARSKGKAVAYDHNVDPLADINQQTTPLFMKRKGTEMSIKGPVITETPMSLIKLLTRVKAHLNPSKSEFEVMRNVLKLRFPDGATESEMNVFIGQWENDHGGYAQANVKR